MLHFNSVNAYKQLNQLTHMAVYCYFTSGNQANLANYLNIFAQF